MTVNDVRDLMRKLSEARGSQKAAATELGVSLPYFNDVMHGRRDPGDSILSGLGLEKVVIYRRAISASHQEPTKHDR